MDFWLQEIMDMYKTQADESDRPQKMYIVQKNKEIRSMASFMCTHLNFDLTGFITFILHDQITVLHKLKETM